MSSVLLQSPAVVAVLAENSASPHAEGSAEVPDPLSTALKTLIGSLQQHYGIWGILTAAVVLLWWQWPKIKELPRVEPFARLLQISAVRFKRRVASSLDNVPRDNDRFTVGVARLINDNDRSEFKELVVEDLKTFPALR